MPAKRIALSDSPPSRTLQSSVRMWTMLRLKGRNVPPSFLVPLVPWQNGGLPAFVLQLGCRPSHNALGVFGLTASGRLFVLALLSSQTLKSLSGASPVDLRYFSMTPMSRVSACIVHVELLHNFCICLLVQLHQSELSCRDRCSTVSHCSSARGLRTESA